MLMASLHDRQIVPTFCALCVSRCGAVATVPRIRRADGEPALAARAGRALPAGLTSAKDTLFCESQHRNIAGLRRRTPDPPVELHPDAARARGIEEGDWVRIETPKGSVLARAKLNAALQADVVCGQHGWWQACDQVGAPGYDPFGPDGANLNLLFGHGALDPVSGSVPLRSYVCDVRRAEKGPAGHSATATASV